MDHIEEFTPDFVLGLLLPEDRKRVLTHLLECESCRPTISEERQLIEDVQAVVQRKTDHNSRRILEMLPAIPGRSRPVFDLSAAWDVVVAFTIVKIVVAGLMLEFERSNGSKIQETKMYTITASTNIESPTFSATATIDEREKGIYPGAFVVIPGSAAPHPEITSDSIQAGRYPPKTPDIFIGVS